MKDIKKLKIFIGMTKRDLKQLIKEVVSEVQNDPMQKYREHPLYQQIMDKQKGNNSFVSILTRKLVKHVIKVSPHVDADKVMMDIKADIIQTMDDFDIPSQ